MGGFKHIKHANAGGGEADEPISGVSLELYVEISRELNARGGDPTLAAIIAQEQGVDAASWDVAKAGWNDRMRTNATIATHFNHLWREVG